MNLDTNHPDDADVLRRLAELPRSTPIDPDGAERVLAQLRREGFFRRREPLSWAIRAVAAILIFALGALAGTRYARGSSLEQQLTRGDLPAAQRVLLLQHAGSNYVRAAELYAAQPADSTGAEVARQVLLGAAGAVARSGLEHDVSQQLARLLTPNRPPVIWF
jgi:hypothetical protein